MGTSILDVGIGLSLLFLFVSLLVTIVQESVASFLGMRAKNLYDALENLLADARVVNAGTSGTSEAAKLVDSLYAHPQIRALYRPARAGVSLEKRAYLPSYIPSRAFAIALVDTLRGTRAGNAIGITSLLVEAEKVVGKLDPSHPLKHTLELLVADARTFEGDLNDKASAVSARIEEWFNDSMARASGWYKRKAQVMSFVIAFGIAAAVNADALRVTQVLWEDGNLRASVSAAAQAYASKPEGDPSYAAVMDGLTKSQLPIGWHLKASIDAFVILGWIATAFAASLGAPFWFGLLDKGLAIRGSGVQVSARSGEAPRKAGEAPIAAPPPALRESPTSELPAKG